METYTYGRSFNEKLLSFGLGNSGFPQSKGEFFIFKSFNAFFKSGGGVFVFFFVVNTSKQVSLALRRS